MTTTTTTPSTTHLATAPLHLADRRHAGRDDLFTHIHKALRKALFDVSVLAGRTDWTDPVEVDLLWAQWTPLLDLLRSHARHEDEHLVRPLDGADDATAARIDDQHRLLEELLDDVAGTMAAAAAARDPFDGLRAYRDLNRFIAAYLPHLHEEETEVMPRIWEARTDDEIAATRAAFMATISPAESMLSMRLMLPAVDPATRVAIVGRVAATAPAPVVEAMLGIAEEVLAAAEAAALRAVAGRAVASRAGVADRRPAVP